MGYQKALEILSRRTAQPGTDDSRLEAEVARYHQAIGDVHRQAENRTAALQSYDAAERSGASSQDCPGTGREQRGRDRVVAVRKPRAPRRPGDPARPHWHGPREGRRAREGRSVLWRGGPDRVERRAQRKKVRRSERAPPSSGQDVHQARRSSSRAAHGCPVRSGGSSATR